MTKELALNIIGGGFSYPSKMPCPSYSIPAQLCKTGGKLREVAGSVCSKCYALKNTYLFPAVRKAMAKRLASIRSPLWPSAMAYLIKAEGNRFFRWHDSGDLQNVGHLRKIIKVCEFTPEVRHWLPTREYGIIQKYKENGGNIPENLTIRLSGHMIDGKLPENLAERLGCVVSAVVSGSATCPSKNQGNQCVDCRACWDKSVKIVSYQKH